MEKFERITDYYEGKLSEEEESLLFSEMASDREIRNDFRAYNIIATSLPKSTVAFTPSDERKNRLFAKAGFANPVAKTPVIVNSAPLGSTTSLLGKVYSYGILHSIMASLLTACVIFYFLNTGNSNTKPDIINTQNQKDIPVVKSENSTSGVVKRDANTQPKIKYVYINRYIPIDSEKDIDQATNLSEMNYLHQMIDLEESTLHNPTINLLASNDKTAFQANLKATNDFQNEYAGTSSPKNWEISVEQSVPWNLGKESINPKSLNKLNNTGLKILYNIDNDLKVGIGIDQSTFSTEYEGIESDGSLYRYRMQPNLTTLSGEVDLKIARFNNFAPYLQFAVGANISGYMVKPAIGVEYEFIDNLSFILGGSYDIYRFTHQSNWFTAYKFRLSYGVNYKL